MNLSIVTAVKDRHHHIVKSAAFIAKQDVHCEHIIVDWASNPPVLRSDLPSDERVRLIRVDRNLPWWLAGAYNLGFSHATGDVILKCDADILPGGCFVSSIEKNFYHADFSCGRLISQHWPKDHSLPSSGLFWARKQALEDIRGFNPYIFGWGWDDVDLYTRLFSAGHRAIQLMSLDTIELKHSSREQVASLFDATRLSDLPDHHSHLLLNSITNLINDRISQLSIAAGLEFPELNKYQFILKDPVSLDQHFPPLKISENELNCLLNDCSYRIWQYTKKTGAPIAFSYIRWRLKLRSYKKIVFDDLISARILPLSLLAD